MAFDSLLVVNSFAGFESLVSNFRVDPKTQKTTSLNLVLKGTIELLIRKIVMCASQYGSKNSFWDRLLYKIKVK